MKQITLRSGLLATTTIAGALATTMGVTAVVSTVAALAPTAAEAQDYTSGAIIGTVTDSSGKTVAGASVTMVAKKTGQTRHFTSSGAGSFSATGLAPGEYDITVTANGFTTYKGTANVQVAQEVRFEAAMQVTGATQTVVVKGHRVRQDFTKTTTGLNVDLDTLVAQEPIARNLTAVAMLAPTVTQGNPGFGNLPSIGGSSVAENAYYIDGLNITNPDTYLTPAAVPFDFYKNVQIQTGGYPAEFGRATGGVLNATSKSGSNDFYFGVHGNYQPMNLRNSLPDYYNATGSRANTKNNSVSVEASGALIKDHLFAYGLYQANDTEQTYAYPLSGTYTDLKNTSPFWGGKLDGYITPTQHLSFTYFNTTGSNKYSYNKYVGSTDTIGAALPSSTTYTGGQDWVVNYAGKVTDWFSLSAAVGHAADKSNVTPSDTKDYYVATYATSGASSITSPNQASSNYTKDAWERKFWRVDGDMRFDAFGQHHVRFGIDDEKNSMLKTTDLVGGEPVQYRIRNYAATSTAPAYQQLQIVYEHLGGNVSSENTAQYLEDSWQITQTLNLQIGVRDDEFKQINLSGEKYMDLKNNVAPRLGFAWTPDADGKWKIFGSVGTNYIPPAMNLGFRGRDLYFAEYFNPANGAKTFTIDPATGLPTNIGSPAVRSGYSTACPTSGLSSAPGFNATNAAAGTNSCVVYGNGTQEGATSKTSIGLKATADDEAILGVSYKINDLWSVGVTGTLRHTSNVSEDSDFNDAIISYLNSKGLDSSQYVGGSSYYVWNVGDHGVTIRLKQPLPGETTQRVITLTADQLGHYHDAKRDFRSVVFEFKRAFDGKWGLQGSYTWERLYGNYNGTVTEYGNGVQTDAGATYAWDSPGMENYGNGPLGNNRTHTFKVFGTYQFTPQFSMGANLLIQSPEKFGCLGLNPDDDYAFGYGDVSHYCGGKPAPLGDGPKSDWAKNLDVSMRYTVPGNMLLGGKLILRADIFNLFDYHQVVTRYLTYDNTDIGKVDSGYGSVTGYNTPRYVRLGFDLTY